MNVEASWLARLRAVNWQRLNYVLIPAARSRRPTAVPFGEPSSRGGTWLLGLYRAFTPEGRWLFVITLITGAFAVDVTHAQVYLLFSLLASTIVASLLVSPSLRLSGLSLRVHAPRRVFVGAEASFVVECSRTIPGPSTAWLRVEGPFLPYFGRWLSRPAPMTEIGESSSTTLKARFSERGDLTLGRFRVSALVPLGLTSGPPLQSAPVRIRVVPRPANVLRLGMDLATRHQPGGVALASKTGESMDLRGVRPYRKGDRIRDLSARTWARTGKPAVREYQEEYFTRVGVVLDCVAPAKRSARSEEAFEAAISLTAGVVAHLGHGDALVDLLVTGGEIHALTLGRSLGFLEQALDHLAGAELEANVDRSRLLERLAPYLARLSAVVIIADGWDEAREAFVRSVKKSGVRVRAVAVGAPASAGVKVVSVASILAGKGLML
ncbi:MAG TPA: DUF58 domain-containing protein [Polyangiaceae bacterium]|nr:DUF58 domain-containing protein [Polyangiaceae bacterium]